MKKTREQVQQLKEQWLEDPCWDIEETPGFEEYRDELLTFSQDQRDKWKIQEVASIYFKAREIGADQLGSFDDNIRLVQYLSTLEDAIEKLNWQVERLKKTIFSSQNITE